MGYLTRHTLRIIDIDNKDDEREIIKHLIQYYDLENTLNENGDCVESCKWYSHTQDLRIFSKLYPKYIFELYGEGQDAGDLWKEYFKNGKSYRVPAKITFDNYDDTRLI